VSHNLLLRRWHNHLNPDIKKTDWTPEEDELLIKLHAELGNQWAKLAQRLEGRTDNAIKNHWNSTLRRRLEDGEFDYLFQPNAQAAPARELPPAACAAFWNHWFMLAVLLILDPHPMA
jgi:hypothetical protein